MAAVHTAVLSTQHLISTREPPKKTLILPTDSPNPVPGGDRDPAMTRPMTALGTQAPVRVRQPILDILSQDLATSTRPLGHRHPGHRSPSRDNRHLNSGQSATGGPALVRTVTVKDTQKTLRRSMHLAQETNRDLPVAMQETALDTLSLNRGREAITDSLSLVTDSQTPVLGEDKDLVMGTL